MKWQSLEAALSDIHGKLVPRQRQQGHLWALLWVPTNWTLISACSREGGTLISPWMEAAVNLFSLLLNSFSCKLCCLCVTICCSALHSELVSHFRFSPVCFCGSGEELEDVSSKSSQSKRATEAKERPVKGNLKFTVKNHSWLKNPEQFRCSYQALVSTIFKVLT